MEQMELAFEYNAEWISARHKSHIDAYDVDNTPADGD
jgi:hypothetical protein